MAADKHPASTNQFLDRRDMNGKSLFRLALQSSYNPSGIFPAGLFIPTGVHITEGITNDVIEEIKKKYDILPHLEIGAVVRGNYYLKTTINDSNKLSMRMFQEDLTGNDILLHIYDPTKEIEHFEYKEVLLRSVERLVSSNPMMDFMMTWYEAGILLFERSGSGEIMPLSNSNKDIFEKGKLQPGIFHASLVLPNALMNTEIEYK